jgi:hypothetical protein
MHIDGKADPAVAYQGKSQLFLPHEASLATKRAERNCVLILFW